MCVAQHFSGAWRALQRIPPGETRSYSAIAGQVGNPAAVRAVANACANNPVCLVVPCHRVIGKNGGLGGYRWGTERKSGCWPTKWSGRAGRARGLESRSKIAGRHDPHAGMASRHGLTRFQKHVDPTSHDFAATNPTQVIVGGGLAGSLTARVRRHWHQGRVARGESHRTRWRRSGREFSKAKPPPAYREIETRYGRKAARAMFEASRRGARSGSHPMSLAHQEDLNVHPASRADFLLSRGKAALQRFPHAPRRRSRCGGSKLLWRSANLDRDRTSGHAISRLGQANPYRIATAFSKAAADRGAAIFEQSVVRRVRGRRKDVEIHAEGGLLTADTVIVYG